MAKAQPTPGPRVETGQPVSEQHYHPREPARIAVYAERHLPPRIVTIPVETPNGDGVPKLIDELTESTYTLVRQQGGCLSAELIGELVANLVHAAFSEVVITILDNGNTLRVSDRGPGIPDKRAAIRPGFTSADGEAKRYIRGVGSGLALVRASVRAMDGTLELEDNLGGGTVVTVRVAPEAREALASTQLSPYNLSQRQLKILLLTLELAPVGPTRIARELGVSTSTAHRDLTILEEQGLIASQGSGLRSVTETGLAHVNTLL